MPREEPEERPEVEAALLRRAEAGLVTRCAWCGRYRFADQWVVVAEAPSLGEFRDVTHGICEDCVGRLRAAGLSA